MTTHEYHPNYSTSTALSEVRTVLGRARTALEVLDRNPTFTTLDPTYGWHAGKSIGTPGVDVPHPDLEEMKDVLRRLVGDLAKFERRGSRQGY